MQLRRAFSILVLVLALPASAQTVKIVGRRVAPPTCGDGAINVSGEECDGSNIGAHTCAEFSCTAGTPTCSGACLITATGCSGCSTGDLLDETFAGSNSGYDLTSWTASGTSTTLSPDATSATGCATGTGWAGDCLKIALDGASFHTGKVTHAFTATPAGVWFHGRLKENFVIGTDTHTVDVMSLSVAGGAQSAGAFYLEVTRAVGPVYTLEAVVPSGGVIGSGFTATDGMSVCVEMFLSSATTTAQWWLNGTDMGSATLPATLTVAPTNLWFGTASALSGTETETQYWDEIKVSSTGRIACN